MPDVEQTALRVLAAMKKAAPEEFLQMADLDQHAFIEISQMLVEEFEAERRIEVIWQAAVEVGYRLCRRQYDGDDFPADIYRIALELIVDKATIETKEMAEIAERALAVGRV